MSKLKKQIFRVKKSKSIYFRYRYRKRKHCAKLRMLKFFSNIMLKDKNY
jgi:hypothetical protein